MSDSVIKVENLSKLYRIGSREAGYRTFRETIVDAARAPFQRLSTVWSIAHRVWGKNKDSHLHAPSSKLLSHDDTIWALKDVSFEVKQGEVVGIIGRNGAGKSTLLKILSKITEPTTGRVELRGRVGSLLEVGTGFHPELTGHENVYLYGAILGMDRWEITRKFDEIIAFAELEKFVDTPVKRYSSGMYMRLAFAVAAHMEPEILLVDEVLAVGDAQFQKKCLGKMGDVAQEGRTVLFVSHNMGAIRKLCSKAILLEIGCVEVMDTTDEVVNRYLANSASETSAIVDLPFASDEAPGVGKFLRFFTKDNKPQSQFRMGEPWKIVLEFELFKPVAHVIAAVGIVTIDAVPIITYWSQPKDLTPGHYFVDFECDIPLKSCGIQFAVGLSSYQRPFYYVQGVGHVSILDVAYDKQPFRASGGGLFFSSQQWEIKKISPNNIKEDKTKEYLQ